MEVKLPLVAIILLITFITIILILANTIFSPSNTIKKESEIYSCCNKYLVCIEIEGKNKKECWNNIVSEGNKSCSYLKKEFGEDINKIYEECKKIIR